MPDLMVDFIISLDGYASADDWPGFWGMEGPEYLAWLGEDAENQHSTLMGATTYRVMSGFAAEMPDDLLTAMPKVVFSSTLKAPLAWANTELVEGDAVEYVRESSRAQREGTHLRRVSGRRSGPDREPHVRRPAPAARVRPHGARRATGHRRLSAGAASTVSTSSSTPQPEGTPC